MYKIIGADGKEYGPISAETLRQWIAEGRANQHTKVLQEGTADWKPLSAFPEFAAAFPSSGAGSLPPGAPPPLGQPPLGSPLGQQFPLAQTDALSQVNGPGIGLIVIGVLNLVFAGPSLIMHLLGVNFVPPNLPPEANWMRFMFGPIGMATNLLTLAIGVLILMGGIKMRALKSYNLAMTAAIFAVIPCTTSCCLIGIPIGIWALVVLLKPEVKNSFH